MVRPQLTIQTFFDQLVYYIYYLDLGYNSFPSLHVALSLTCSLICFNYNPKYKWLFIWAGLIILSTVLVKQHYILDVVGGLVLGVLGFLWFRKNL